VSADLQHDWRYSTFLKYHRGLRFRGSVYTPAHEGDDDHCIACWQKFAELDAPGIEHEGYVTPYVADYPGEGLRTQYRWVCNTCWADFRDFMNWQEDLSPR
jgi:hypothetical protein